jgi:tripartite-type tricarboxylate transporter receptor subunit TctC
MISTRLFFAAVFAMCLLLSANDIARAQSSYPDKPIRIIATLSAGSQVDILTRIVAEKMSASMKQPVIVENLLGAGGSIAAARVASAPKDGYTLLVTANGHAINPSLYDKLPFDTRKDFAGVSLLATVPSVLVVSNGGPKTVSELVSRARAKPGTITYASAGVGSASHLAAELFRTLAMIDMVHVPYKGTAEMISDLVAGRVDFSISPIGASSSLIRENKARGLAITSTTRSTVLPNVPTLVEAGVANYQFDFWYGVFAPSGTPSAVVDRLAVEIQKALALPDVKEKFAAQSAMPSDLTQARFDRFVNAEIDRYAGLVKSSGARQSAQ